ncbi:MAG: Copper chaperone CopZ [Paracidovorax wautersii]|uniref:Copper chaperone CopZ n=1 Tax=Paracidovorax wautersii TaxID=1177982 RepID=A0A7V8FL59_9BURK|nr:MAG: Copper chaperone CopZ [Paracidovorax wautersii]
MSEILDVQGMTCGHCEKAVTRAILQLDLQAQVRITREANRVEVANTPLAREALAAAIREAGYTVPA